MARRQTEVARAGARELKAPLHIARWGAPALGCCVRPDGISAKAFASVVAAASRRPGLRPRPGRSRKQARVNEPSRVARAEIRDGSTRERVRARARYARAETRPLELRGSLEGASAAAFNPARGALEEHRAASRTGATSRGPRRSCDRVRPRSTARPSSSAPASTVFSAERGGSARRPPLDYGRRVHPEFADCSRWVGRPVEARYLVHRSSRAVLAVEQRSTQDVRTLCHGGELVS